ncbi:MAG: acetoin dehydrogenase dihydrolipoyllysine-residue acetyltransferase subunit, partial [Granulosicoccus sp.]
DSICEFDASKLSNDFESPVADTLRRLVAAEDEMLPVGALIAVVAEADVSDADIEQFVVQFQESFVPEETDSGGPEPQSVIVDGKKLVYLKMGDSDKTPVLLLHGFGADINGWLFNQADLAEVATVYALDLPGHGQSVKDVGDGDIPSLARVVLSFMQELSIASAHLVGHSMGAAIAVKMAADSTQSVASLTLIGPAGLGEEINTDFLRGYIAAKRQKHLRPVLEQLVSDASLISSDMMEDVFKFKRIDGVTEGLERLVDRNFADGRQTYVLRDDLQKLPMPVMVVWGEHDQIIPASHANGLAAGMTVQLIENSGHIPQMENAARVNELIRSNIQTSV